MNIIKLKDQIMPDSMNHAEYFNKHLKGKYAYWVQMRYIVSFDHMRHEGYVACEEDISKLLQREDGSWPKPYGAPSIDVYEKGIMNYVDPIETDRINNTIEFRLKNTYTPDDNITIDELKQFRTWLASELLKMDRTELGEQKKSLLNHIETHVLEYYAADMYDNTIKILSDFSNIKVVFTDINNTTCNCHHDSNISSLYNMELNSCDPISIYKQNIYNHMVDMFSNTSFWTQWSPEFIGEFKKYIDNIIKCNLSLSKSDWFNSFLDCNCQDTNTQDKYIGILKNLSISLGYIKDGQISGHKNYINDSLSMWSKVLYENMKW